MAEDTRRAEPPSRVAEAQPPLLGDWFIYLSIIVLVCGVIAITALELGAALSEPIVRVPALLGGALLLLVAVDRGRGFFRFVWSGVLAAIAAAAVGWLWLVATA